MSNENKRQGFVFYRSFYEALSNNLINDATFRRLVSSICEYSLEDKDFIPESDLEALVWSSIKPQLKANNDRYHNGTKGGRKRTIDRAKVTELHRKGYSQGYIAEQLGCSRKAINSILSEIKKGVTVTKPKEKEKEKEKEKGASQVTPVKLDKVLKAEMTEKLRS